MLEKCSPTDRALLRKHYLAGFTSSEIAQHLNCSAVTVRVRLLRLRRRMQTEMTARPIGAAPVCA
jgi:RNA polymerase sigma factor (sigma-70 family)